MTPLWLLPPMAGLLPKLSERLRNSGIELTEQSCSLISLPGKSSVGDAGADCDNKGLRFAGGGISQSSTEAAVAAAAPFKLSFLESENDDKILLWTDADSG